MVRLGIPVLPSIVNALIATSIFSAGNAYMFGTSRSLYSLALQGCVTGPGIKLKSAVTRRRSSARSTATARPGSPSA